MPRSPQDGYPARARCRSVIILVLDPSGPSRITVTRELAHTHRSRVRVEQADGRDAHELVDQDLLADNGLGARHLARRSRCPRPRARPPGPPSHLGRVRSLTLTPGYLKSHARPGGIRTRLGVWLAASASSPPCLARSVGSSADRMLSRVASIRAACEAAMLPRGGQLAPPPVPDHQSLARPPSPALEDGSMPMAAQSRTARQRPRSSRFGQSRAEAAASRGWTFSIGT